LLNKKIIKEISQGCKNPKLDVISLGMGVQSTAMYLMSCIGSLPKADFAIFSDTGAEHSYTYKYLEFLKKYQKKNNGVPIIVTSKNPNLYKSIIDEEGLISIPAFIKYDDGNSIISRSCTANYKINPIYKEIRSLLKLKPYERTKHKVNVWIGITTDEIGRASKSHFPIMVNKYPLLEKLLSRKDCIDFYKNFNFEVPKKSSCVFCPYQSDESFLNMKKNNSSDWKVAVEIDNLIRKRITKNSSAEVYVHRKREPLEDIKFKGEEQKDLFENNCEGHCGL
tara:strand:+ start:717 stop:1556 length:840 start_codon:yes stop_codon:yes gene_type:complete